MLIIHIINIKYVYFDLFNLNKNKFHQKLLEKGIVHFLLRSLAVLHSTYVDEVKDLNFSI